MSIWNRKPVLSIQKIHCGAGVQDFPKIAGEQDEFIQVASFTGKFILLLTASQQHSECLQVSQLLPRGSFQKVSKHAALDAPAAPAPLPGQRSKSLGAPAVRLSCSAPGSPPPWATGNHSCSIQIWGRSCSGCSAPNTAGAIKKKPLCVQVSLLFGNCLSGSAARWEGQTCSWHLSSQQCESVPCSFASYRD